MRNAGRVLGALLCTAALAGSALALRVVPGGRVLALLFCSPGAAFTLWQQAGVEPPQAQPAAALAESSESPPQPTPEPSVQPTPAHTAAHGGTGSHPGPNHYHTAGGAGDSAHP